MLKLDPIQTFVEVVRANGFTAAARRTGMPRSTVSLQVRMLEEELDVRLFKRTTRSLALTDEGQRLYARAADAMDELVRAVDEVRSAPGTLRGLIRLTAPADFPTEPLAGAITGFTRVHPDIRFQIMLTNQSLELVQDNIDIAIRVGDSGSQESIEHRLLDIDWCFCAGAPWLERNRRPSRLADISDFISPKPALRAYLERTVLRGAGLPTGLIEVDSHAMACDLMVSGFGIALLPIGLCEGAIARGDAERLFPTTALRTTRLNLTFPNRADMVPRVRAFADYLCDRFR